MANSTIDDVLRNLTVFLKGQIPSLQSKHSVFEISQQVQSIIMNLRTSITQLEGAGQSDPRSAPEYKALARELETMKAAHQKLEESLFLEMNKNERINQERNKDYSVVQEARDRMAKADEQIRTLEANVAELQAQLAKAQAEAAKPRLPSGIEPGIKAAYDRKVAEAERQRDGLAQTLHEKDAEIMRLNQQIHDLDITVRDDQARMGVLRQEIKHLTEQRDGLVSRLTDLEQGLTVERSDFVRIKNELEQKIAQLERDIEASPTREAMKNIAASSEAKIRYLEKTVDDLKKQLREREQHQAALPEQITQVLKDKTRLEQQVIDLEAMIRRFTAEKLQRDSEAVTTPASPLATEENIFFFEMLTQILLQVPDIPDYKELRSKAEEGIAILERHRMIQLIPTVGSAFNDRQHKVVRSFQTGMLEDGTIIYEVNRGYSFGDQIVQRALVWIAKSRFKCHSCGAQARGPDNFCPKCGLELCTPDGISKRKLTPLPPTTEICLPLIDYFLDQRHLAKAEELLDYLPPEKQLLPATVKRRNRLQEMKSPSAKEST